jgi:hypothetical protein
MTARFLLAPLVVLLSLAAAPAMGEEKEWAVTLLGGRYSAKELLDVGGSVDLRDSYAAGLSISYQFVDWGKHMRWELEGQVLQHFGEQTMTEFVGSINVRWITFPWNRYLDTSMAFGGGLSVTTEVPELEKSEAGSEAVPLLHYLLFEAAVGLPGSDWSLVGRLHHRSGIFGLFSHSGSQLLEIGVRYRF